MCNTGTCTEAVIVLYKEHVVEIKKGVSSQDVSNKIWKGYEV